MTFNPADVVATLVLVALAAVAFGYVLRGRLAVRAVDMASYASCACNAVQVCHACDAGDSDRLMCLLHIQTTVTSARAPIVWEFPRVRCARCNTTVTLRPKAAQADDATRGSAE